MYENENLNTFDNPDYSFLIPTQYYNNGKNKKRNDK